MYASGTIVAVATPPGRGGIGIIRLSGEASLTIAAALFRPSRSAAWTPHRLRHGWIVDHQGRRLDEALAVWMPAAHSYTGEDVVELQGHGSPALQRHVVAAALAAGARLAQRGEFTERAFLNGRLDLAQAEAVIDLIEARGSAALQLAAAQLHGALSAALASVRAELIDLKALLEVQIDFSEEDVSIATADLVATAQRAAVALDGLIASYAHGKRVREGLRVAIAGRPNVGKSSLLNALLGEERAIVTAIAGTTRDVIEESIEIEGVPVVLSDTAGLRPQTEADEVERFGIERTGGAIDRADLVLVVLDGSQPLTAADEAVLHRSAGRWQVIVINKSDLELRVDVGGLVAFVPAERIVRVSARQSTGLDALRAQVAARVHDALPESDGQAVLTNERQRDALAHARDALAAVVCGLAAGEPADLLAVLVQEALDRAGAVTGAVSGEDVLDRVFSRFCIGK